MPLNIESRWPRQRDGQRGYGGSPQAREKRKAARAAPPVSEIQAVPVPRGDQRGTHSEKISLPAPFFTLHGRERPQRQTTDAQPPQGGAAGQKPTRTRTERETKVATARGLHLFPFRTEKLNPATPMVLRKWESR